jgi:hypothetical protein
MVVFLGVADSARVGSETLPSRSRRIIEDYGPAGFAFFVSQRLGRQRAGRVGDPPEQIAADY